LLDQFITDAYGTDAVRSLARHVSGKPIDTVVGRHAAGIPDDRVRCLWSIAIREQIRHAAGVPQNRTWLHYDPYYSLAAAKRAQQSRADLLLYSPYAWEAFVAKYSHHPRRVLFQYHPHPDTERRLLESDAARFPGEAATRELDARPAIAHLLMRERDCWKHADLIICSSAFTVRSLTDAGCPAERCVIVPYGTELPPCNVTRGPDHFHALFVGTGSRRKGLHHLLLAWSRASLPEGSRLTIVSRALDPGLERVIAATPGVELIKGANASALSALYSNSTVFVMPSMVEGFGLVYLEALAHACPVLGTTNTCLPDLGDENDGVFLTPAGEPDTLIDTLERLSTRLPGDIEVRRRARATAERYPWPAFRESLRRAVRDSR
jgi:glycosyltransferase involved in cell wall biosynthesis